MTPSPNVQKVDLQGLNFVVTPTAGEAPPFGSCWRDNAEFDLLCTWPHSQDEPLPTHDGPAHTEPLLVR